MFTIVTNNQIIKRAEKGLVMKISEKYVEKTYTNSQKIKGIQVSQRYNNEVLAYLYFETINWKNAPKLLSYNDKIMYFKIEKINNPTIHDCLMENIPIDIGWLIKKLVHLEKELIDKKIFVRTITTKDIILDIKKNKLWLIDYEDSMMGTTYKYSLLYALVWEIDHRKKTFYIKSKQSAELKKTLYKQIKKYSRYSSIWRFIFTYCLYGLRSLRRWQRHLKW